MHNTQLHKWWRWNTGVAAEAELQRTIGRRKEGEGGDRKGDARGDGVKWCKSNFGVCCRGNS